MDSENSIKDQLRYLPPSTPYVNIRMLTLVAKLDAKNAHADHALPITDTVLQPYLLHSRPATGPVGGEMIGRWGGGEITN